MHSSTAFASSGRILRILSSDFGDLLRKLSQASYRIAAGEVEPGRKIDKEDADERYQQSITNENLDIHTRNFLY